MAAALGLARRGRKKARGQDQRRARDQRGAGLTRPIQDFYR